VAVQLLLPWLIMSPWLPRQLDQCRGRLVAMASVVYVAYSSAALHCPWPAMWTPGAPMALKSDPGLESDASSLFCNKNLFVFFIKTC